MLIEHISLTPVVSALFLLFPCLLAIIHWIDPELLELWISDRRVIVTAAVTLTFGGIALMVG